jgi:hypothetical protein
MVNQNVLLTGIPRSGTTLACSLLNRLPQVLALIEPMNMRELTAAGTDDNRIQYIADYLAQIRNNALEQGIAPRKLLSGDGTNTFAKTVDGKRASTIQRDQIAPVDKPLRQDFTLVVKHPNAFAALLPVLAGRFKCVAIVRNPLAVLASWNSLDHALSRGHAPMAEKFDSELAMQLRQENDPFIRQVRLLDWYFDTFTRCLPANHVVRYEDMIDTSGAALSIIDDSAQSLNDGASGLESQNDSRLYNDPDVIRRAADLLLADQDHTSWVLYDRHSVLDLRAILLDR